MQSVIKIHMKYNSCSVIDKVLWNSYCMVNMLLQAHLYFVLYSIGIDFASMVVKIKYLVVWGWSAPKGHPQPHTLCITYYTYVLY